MFKYNAWEMDYYDDPLIGIVLTLCEQLNNLISSSRWVTVVVSETEKYYIAYLLNYIVDQFTNNEVYEKSYFEKHP